MTAVEIIQSIIDKFERESEKCKKVYKAIPFEDIVITIREMDNGTGVVDCNDLINSLENLIK